MEFKYNVTGDERKALVAAIGELKQIKPRYLGAPLFAYEVGYIRISKDGAVSFDDCVDSEEFKRITDSLSERGFKCECSDSLTIEISRDGMNDTAIGNLRKLVAGKTELIKKALGAANLNIDVSDDKISFPWFNRIPEHEETSAYTHFIEKLVAMARSLHRVNATSRDTYNEKYAFRCFLLRLGFIGEEYKSIRKVLLKNLTGSSAFKQNSEKAVEVDE